MELVYKLIQNLLLYFVIAIGENSLKMKNNAMMLSSVYDAMKSNGGGGEGYRNAFYPNDLLSYDLRNKRNINEKWDVDNVVQYEEPAHAIKPESYIDKNDLMGAGSELICSVYNHRTNTNSERLIFGNPFENQNALNGGFFGFIGHFMAKALKVILAGLALVSLPLLFFVAIVLPLKLILGIKAFAVSNSLVFGTLIYRLLYRLVNRHTDSDDTTTEAPFPAPMSAASDNFVGGGPANDDYGDYNEEQVQRILKTVKKGNKNW